MWRCKYLDLDFDLILVELSSGDSERDLDLDFDLDLVEPATGDPERDLEPDLDLERDLDREIDLEAGDRVLERALPADAGDPDLDLEPDLDRDGAGLRVADGLRLPEPDLDPTGDLDATELLEGDGEPGKKAVGTYIMTRKPAIKYILTTS